MTIKLITACDENWGIGYKNDLLYHVPLDMERFVELTTGHYIVYGRKTLESFPKQQPLPHRINVLLTRNLSYPAPTNVIKMNSIENIINHYNNSGIQDKDLWVIGGSEIYKQFMPYVDEAYITIFHCNNKIADAFFPYEHLNEFEIIDREYREDEKTGMKMHFNHYTRK